MSMERDPAESSSLFELSSRFIPSHDTSEVYVFDPSPGSTTSEPSQPMDISGLSDSTELNSVDTMTSESALLLDSSPGSTTSEPSQPMDTSGLSALTELNLPETISSESSVVLDATRGSPSIEGSQPMDPSPFDDTTDLKSHETICSESSVVLYACLDSSFIQASQPMVLAGLDGTTELKLPETISSEFSVVLDVSQGSPSIEGSQPMDPSPFDDTTELKFPGTIASESSEVLDASSGSPSIEASQPMDLSSVDDTTELKFQETITSEASGVLDVSPGITFVEPSESGDPLGSLISACDSLLAETMDPNTSGSSVFDLCSQFKSMQSSTFELSGRLDASSESSSLDVSNSTESFEHTDYSKVSESCVFAGLGSESNCGIFLRGCVTLCQTSEKILKNHPKDLDSAESLVELLRKLRNKTNDVQKKLSKKNDPEMDKIRELHRAAFSLWKQAKDDPEIQEHQALILVELKRQALAVNRV